MLKHWLAKAAEVISLFEAMLMITVATWMVFVWAVIRLWA
jgi:hypothetical protein